MAKHKNTEMSSFHSSFVYFFAKNTHKTFKQNHPSFVERLTAYNKQEQGREYSIQHTLNVHQLCICRAKMYSME